MCYNYSLALGSCHETDILIIYRHRLTQVSVQLRGSTFNQTKANQNTMPKEVNEAK